MRRLLAILVWVILILVYAILMFAPTFLLATPARADTLYLPLIRGGPIVTVTGQAKWEEGYGPVAHRRFALLEALDENFYRHKSESPHARTDAEGRFTFRSVADGVYVLAIEMHPPFDWALVWYDTTLYLVMVKGESVEMGIVRVGVTHLWQE